MIESFLIGPNMGPPIEMKEDRIEMKEDRQKIKLGRKTFRYRNRYLMNSKVPA